MYEGERVGVGLPTAAITFVDLDPRVGPCIQYHSRRIKTQSRLSNNQHYTGRRVQTDSRASEVMSSAGQSGESSSKAPIKNGLLRSSSPARVKQKSSSSSLSSQLSAHLTKPVTPRVATTLTSSGDSPPSTTERRPLVGVQQSGKAVASAADVEDLAHSELWKTNAAKRAEKEWALQSEKGLQSDPKFKKYTLAVEKSLATFESVSEWADFIAFLGRLLKTFQLSPSFNAVPRKLIVAKRLSQCLNPALPSGVHQRALDVYEHILTVIGREGLRRDLLVWSPGLMPFFQYASTSVKPIVLSIFERHYLALGQDLRPVTRAFLLAGLPGLEEDTNEFFDRVLRLLDRTRDSVGQPFFLQTLCLILISSPEARLPALNYLSRRLPKLNGDDAEGDPDSVSAIIGSDPGLLVRGFAAALEDETSLLVRRAALDILVTHLRLDSVTWKQYVKHIDKVRLIKAALAVVLRRDLSLNRRLYAWILGPSEEIPAQQKYFEENAQQLSRLALLSDLIRCPLVQIPEQDRERGGADRQRPYKIFVSLLDKWSIGQPLTNALILDTYHSLQWQMEGIDDERTKTDPSLKAAATDISTTAKMLFEVVDPFATYRQFFYAIVDEMRGKPKMSFSVIALLRFVLKSFRVHDEESRQIHLPVLLSVLMELLEECSDQEIKAGAIQLALTMLALIPKRIFLRTQGQTSIDTSFISHAQSFYESDSYNADEAAQRYIGFQHPSTQSKLLDLSSHIPQVDDGDVSDSKLHLFSTLLRILDSTLDVATEDKQASMHWNANEWIQSMLPRMQVAQQFKQLEAYTSAIVDSAKCRALENVVNLGKNDTAPVLLTKLLAFLQVQWTPYHTRTVELVWSVADLARGRYLEILLCKGLTSSVLVERRQTQDVFGALWQYSHEERLSSTSMTEPLLQILDALRSSDWSERQASERWIKANLRGYTLFLDPLLHILKESGIQRQAHAIKHKDRSFPFHRYTKAFDHEQVIYALGVMLQLAKFGGQGFVKALRSVQIKKSYFKSILTANDADLDSSYLRVLLTDLLLFIRSDANPANPYIEAYTTMHVLAAELLQAIIMRGPLQGNWLTEVEGALLERLYVSIQRRDLTVHASLLQALQSVIRVKTSEGTLRDHAPHALLVVVIRDGISKRKNRPVLSNWTDFILNIIPHYRSAVSSLLLPLNEVVCQLLVSSVAYHKSALYTNAQDGSSELGESDLIFLMNINERLLLQCLDSADTLVGESPKISATISEKADSGGLMGAFSNVFQADSSSTSTAAGTVASPNAILQTLHHSIRSLHVVWTAFNGTSSMDGAGEAKQRFLEVINPRVKARCRRSFEKVYRNNSGEVVESLIDCWNAAGGVRKIQLQGAGIATNALTAGLDHRGMEATMEILSTLAPSAQIVVTFLCDVISTRAASTTSTGEKTANKKTPTPIVTESVLMSFWEAYLDRLDSAASMQVWPVVIMLVRDILHNSSAHKAQMYPILRCFTVTGEKIVNAAGGNEDKKMKRELVDNYLKLCDFNILIAGRSFDQTNWIGRRALATNDEEGEESGRATPTMAEEKMGASIGDLPVGGGSSLIDSIIDYLGNRALPALRLFNVDADKVLTVCTNVVYYIITPVVRQRRKTLEVPLPILKLLSEVTKLSGTVRAWKNVVADVFQDGRFFQMRGEVGLQWLPIVLSLLNSDKERFVELITKVTSTPSTNIFTNKEAETLARGNNLKRIAAVIYAAEKDHWLTHLPPLQEKLVDLLRNGTTDPIGSDVYLCLRVLLLRFSSRHLSAFWPVIITELMRLFEGCLEEVPADDSDALQLVYSACKFLDFLLTLQTNDFQIHQWLFITDTVDVVYPPSDWTPDSILDRMASLLLKKKNGKTSKSGVKDALQYDDTKANGSQDDIDVAAADLVNTKRKPQLTGLGSTVSKIEELQPFFAHVSLYAFEQTYDCGENIDWKAVEQSVEADLFPVED